MRLIDADALLESMNAIVFRNVPVEHQPYVDAACKAFKAVAKAVPIIDAVEVVRCKDCQAWGRSPYGHPTIGWCIVQGRHRAPDYFCASAKKRESVEVKVNG